MPLVVQYCSAIKQQSSEAPRLQTSQPASPVATGAGLCSEAHPVLRSTPNKIESSRFRLRRFLLKGFRSRVGLGRHRMLRKQKRSVPMILRWDASSERSFPERFSVSDRINTRRSTLFVSPDIAVCPSEVSGSLPSPRGLLSRRKPGSLECAPAN